MKILDTFAKLDKIIKKIATDNPEEIASSLGFEIIILSSNLVGYITKIQNQTLIGINRRLSPVKRRFVAWHEIGHGVAGHLKEYDFTNSSSYHLDQILFAPDQQLNSKTISKYEREANLIAAEYCIDTERILEMIGYNNAVIKQFRSLKETQNKLRQEYERLLFAIKSKNNCSDYQKFRLAEYKNELAKLDEKKQELGTEISLCEILSIPEIAQRLHTSSIIVEYKLEALRLRGYNIEGVELATYNKVFKQEVI